MLPKVATFLLILKVCSGGRVLCILPGPFYSHQAVFFPVWRELANRGHDVTVATPNPRNLTLPNLKQIDWSFTYKLIFEDHKMQDKLNTHTNLFMLYYYLVTLRVNSTQEQLKVEAIQQLIKSEENFDVVIVEAAFFSYFSFGRKFGAPIVGISSMQPPGILSRSMGNVFSPVLNPNANLPFEGRLRFPQRVLSFLFEVMDVVIDQIFVLVETKIMREAFDDPGIDLAKLQNQMSLLLVATIPGFSRNVPSIPSIIQLNGLQVNPPQPLPKDIQEFLDGATQGAIFFSLGSSVKSALVSNETRGVVFETFRELPFRVLWKFERSFTDLPGNIKIVPWAPQQDILRHKNVKLFVMQGGFQSIEEAIRSRVPMLAIPFFGDQFSNSLRIETLKIGLCMDFQKMSKEAFKSAVLRAVDNPEFKDNLAEMSDLLRDPPMGSLDKAVWWIEHVMRHKGAPHLRSPLADMAFYQYYSLDVVLFLASLAAILFLAVVKILQVVCGVCRGKRLVGYLKKNQ